MPFFPYSTPERRSNRRILPIIPNEIYLHILEHLSPFSGRLDDDELQTLARLSAVCRLYANLCLPRIFEYIRLSVPKLDGGPPTAPDGVYDISSGTTLLSQIAANQPLALFLAKSVRSCHFRNRRPFVLGPKVGLTPKEYIVGLSQMTNIRELKFYCSFVNEDHWRILVSLQSLEELCFDGCDFLEDAIYAPPRKTMKLHVNRLQVTNCIGDFECIAAIDAPSLRALTVDDCIICDINWLPRSALTEFSLCLSHASPWTMDLEAMDVTLERTPQTIETLSLEVDLDSGDSEEDIFEGLEDIFNTPAWSNLPLLRSLTLRFEHAGCSALFSAQVHAVALNGIGRLTHLRSCILRNHELSPSGIPEMPPSELRHMLHDYLGPRSSLTHVDCFGTTFHLLDGEWSEVDNSTM